MRVEKKSRWPYSVSGMGQLSKIMQGVLPFLSSSLALQTVRQDVPDLCFPLRTQTKLFELNRATPATPVHC